MKIFSLLLLTFAIIGLGKAGWSEDTSGEWSPAVLSEKKWYPLPNKDFIPGPFLSSSRSSGCIEWRGSGPLSGAWYLSGGKKCPRKDSRTWPIPDIPDIQVPEIETFKPNPCGEPRRCRTKNWKVWGIPQIPELGFGSLGSCTCGWGNDKNLIIGGSTVKPPYKYPWVVKLQKNGKTFCAGTLISDQYILTAAHCLAKAPSMALSSRTDFYRPNEIKVSFVTRTTATSPGVPVMEVIPHPKYNYRATDHDIALIKLSRKVQCSKYRRPVCLPNRGKRVNIGQSFVTVGWGTERGGRPGTSSHLKEAKIRTVPFSACKNKFWHVEGNFYCLKGEENSSPCHGDSGGPMFANLRNRYYVFGVTSMHSSLKCDPRDAFIYTKVPKYLSWINSVIGRRAPSSGLGKTYLIVRKPKYY